MSLSLNDLCDKILSSLDKGLVTVTQSLHYTYKSKHMFGVPCTCTGVPHPAVIEYCSEGAKCTNGNIMQLDEKHLYWSKKVVELTTLIPPLAESLSHDDDDVATTVSEDKRNAEKIFRHHSFNISKSIANNITRVVDQLWASGLISDDIKDSLSTVLGIDNYNKASRLMDNEPLKLILINILKELGKPPPQDSRQDCSKSSSLHKRPKAAQKDMFASKRFQIDSEDSYDSGRNTSDDGQFSGSGILQNENRGQKRHREEDSSPGDFTTMKKSTAQTSEVISLLSDDDDVIILDPPPPSDKGYDKRSTGNKPHRRKTGSNK
uniref:Uncharacterized protein n=1 Tax=Amphimedon queenslandica TaxID=400682 RepID=A0A1X7SS92_AMPQE